MSDKRQFNSGGVATARRPRLLVASGASGAAFTGKAVDQLRRLGWEVVPVAAADAVRAALSRKATAMLLPVETGAESGHLIAAKVQKAKPKLKVVLIGSARTPLAERYAAFVGAGFLGESDGMSELIATLDA